MTPGLFESLKNLAGALLAIIHTRLDMLSHDIEEARLHVGLMLVYVCAALLCFGLSIMLLTVFIVVLFWDTHRLPVVGGLCVFFLAAGLLSLNSLRRHALSKPRLFSATLAELHKDRERLATPHE